MVALVPQPSLGFRLRLACRSGGEERGEESRMCFSLFFLGSGSDGGVRTCGFLC
jgi:hypothetical protein